MRKESYSPGYLEISLRQFGKNKLAVLGSIIIMMLFAIAIYSPLIANNKPLVLYAPFTDKYEDTLYVAISNIENTLKSALSDDSKGYETNLTYTHRSLKTLRRFLPKRERKELRNIQTDVIKTLAKKDSKRIAELTQILEKKFLELNIKYHLRFPAIKSLSPLYIFFMILYPLFIVLVVIKNVFRKRYVPLKVQGQLTAATLISVIGAVIWWISVPAVFDPSDYKNFINEIPDNGFYLMPIVPYGENENIITEASQKPSWLMPVENRTENYHLLGTDTNGRDVLCRMVWGTRISMSIGFIAVGICLAIGIFFGSIAGYFRGWLDVSISRMIEVVICFPVFFLILTVLAFLRPSIINIMVVIGLTGWTGIARLCRGEFLKLVKQDFVVAAHALGASHNRIIFKHILQNGLGPVLVAASFGIAGAILTESALSFLGFGVPQPTASWGDLLNNGRNDIQGTWWLTIFPGLAIFIAVTAFNLAGEGLRDALDPRLKHD
ncbi:MAG: ABC transporter permease [Candidatus Auribacterota bacterium]